MCNTTVFQPHQQQQPPPFSLSTFQLLRSSCNRLILSNSGQLLTPDSQAYYSALAESETLLLPAATAAAVSYRHSTANDYMMPADMVEAPSALHTPDQSSSQSQDINVLDDPESSEMGRSQTPSSRRLAKSQLTSATGETLLFRSSNEGGGGGGGAPLSSESATSPFRSGSSKCSLPAFEYIAPPPVKHAAAAAAAAAFSLTNFPPLDFNRIPAAIFPGFMQRRTRGEKRTIPDEQKDEKYYERRKRNNEAAKKSRDARKIREDRNAFRAALLEQENSILRAQVMALRDELTALIATTRTTSRNNKSLL